MKVGSIFGQKLGQVFVMEFAVCGGWPGRKLGVLGRWGSGDYLDEVWKEVAGWSEGNCEVSWCWVAAGMWGDQRWFQWVEWPGDGEGNWLCTG